jgi:NADH-quinone oxidoreductase subunit M
MLMLAGIFDARNPGVGGYGFAVVGVIGILLSAWYMLTMLQRVFFGPEKEPAPVATPVKDLNSREVLAFGSLAVLCLALGLVPQTVLDSVQNDVRKISFIGDKARERAGIPLPAENALQPTPKVPVLKGATPKGVDKKGGGKNKGGNNKGGGAPKGGKVLEEE